MVDPGIHGHGIFFRQEGQDLNFPLGGGAIFQPRGGPGGRASLRDFGCTNVDIYNNKMRCQPIFFC